jgi:hypothetical protein
MVPEHLRPVLAALRRAYPDGVPPGEYLPLLVENDAAAAVSLEHVDTAEIDRMKRHIGASGRTFEL